MWRLAAFFAVGLFLGTAGSAGGAVAALESSGGRPSKKLVDGMITAGQGPRPVAARMISRAAPKSMAGPLACMERWSLAPVRWGEAKTLPWIRSEKA